MIVLDASVLIAHLDAGDAHHERARDVLNSVGSDPLCASPLTLAEVLTGPARVGRLERAVEALHLLDIATAPLDGHAPVTLALMRSSTGLKLPDCCVLLAAEQAHGEVATFDARMASTARARGLQVRDR